ncbi:MAG: molybdopterin-dependent oxidoreductase [Anaerolineae bacterium]|nr:molybdopterin-dependent oxidoreductase [Anaerolineae bacterium]
MKRILVVLLLTMLIVACSTPTSPMNEPTPTMESVASSSPVSEPTPSEQNPAPSPSATLESEQKVEIPWGIEQRHPAEVDNSTLPITPVEELHRTGSVQEYDIDDYRLVLDGLVDNPLSLSYEDILARPQVSELALLICPGFFWDNATWTGTPLSLILEEAGPLPEAAKVRIVSGGYSTTLSLEEATADGVFLAYEVNGETLPVEHGYPLRLVARHQYGSKWVKWVERIEVIE